STNVRREQVSGRAEYCQPGKVSPNLIIVEEEESLVLLNRSTNVSAKRIALIYGLETVAAESPGCGIEEGYEAQRISRAELLVAVEKEAVAVEFVCSALCDGVGHAASSATIFGRIV